MPAFKAMLDINPPSVIILGSQYSYGSAVIAVIDAATGGTDRLITAENDEGLHAHYRPP